MITLLAMTLMFLSNSAFCLSVKVLSDYELTGFKIIESAVNHTGTDACIRKVTNGTAVYILKQINNSSYDEQFLLVNDAIASAIGTSNNIHVNEVTFIPHNVGSKIKIYPDRAATLHALVAGHDLEGELPDFLTNDFSLHQRVINPDSLWQKKFPLESRQQGLIKELIENMGAHKDLAPIVALDTFVGNTDRSLPNVFYDKKSNCFYGIDQAAAFAHVLSIFATERLKELSASGYFIGCPISVIESLKLFRSTLANLVACCTPLALMNEMKKLAFHLGAEAFGDHEVKARLNYHQQIIEENYANCSDLLFLLSK